MEQKVLVLIWMKCCVIHIPQRWKTKLLFEEMILLIQSVFYHYSPEGLTLSVHRVCLGVWPTIKARGECQGFSLKSTMVHPAVNAKGSP